MLSAETAPTPSTGKVLKSKALATEPSSATVGTKLLKLPSATTTAPGAEQPAADGKYVINKLVGRPKAAGDGSASVLKLQQGTAPQDEQLAALPPPQRFAPPKGPHGLPLLACLTADGQQCGAPAALAFCQAQGYQRAGGFNTDKRKGNFETLSGQPCAEKRCKIFTELTCAN